MKKIMIGFVLIMAVATVSCSSGLTEDEIREIVRAEVAAAETGCHAHMINVIAHEHRVGTLSGEIPDQTYTAGRILKNTGIPETADCQ